MERNLRKRALHRTRRRERPRTHVVRCVVALPPCVSHSGNATSFDVPSPDNRGKRAKETPQGFFATIYLLRLNAREKANDEKLGECLSLNFLMADVGICPAAERFSRLG